MRHCSLFSFLLAICLLRPDPTLAAERPPVVAVFDIEDTRGEPDKFSKKTLTGLTDYLTTKLAIGGKFKIVPRASVRKALLDKKIGTHKPCYDEKCQIEIGREIAAEKSLSTKIDQVGDECIVTSALYDLRQSTSGHSASYRGPCGKSEILTAIEQIALQLRGEKASKGSKEIRFDTSGLPTVPTLEMPSDYNAASSGLDFSNVDVDAMEAYNAAVEGEKNPRASVEERISLWQVVQEKAPVYRKHASERIIAWKEFARTKKQIEEVQQKRAAKMMEDWSKLSRLLKLAVISSADKRAWQEAFYDAYHKEVKDNPFARNPMVQDFINSLSAEMRRRPKVDRDQDGVIDSEDQCPDEPENWDGFQDHDGCPDGWDWASFGMVGWRPRSGAFLATFSTTALTDSEDKRGMVLVGVNADDVWYEFELALGYGWQDGDDAPDSDDTGLIGRLRFGLPLLSWPNPIQSKLSLLNLSGGIETWTSIEVDATDPFRFGLGVWAANTIRLWKRYGIRVDFSQGLKGSEYTRIGFSFLHYDNPIGVRNWRHEIMPQAQSGDWEYSGLMIGTGLSALVDADDTSHLNRIPFFAGLCFNDSFLELYGGFGPMWGTADGKNYFSTVGDMWWIPLITTLPMGFVAGVSIIPIVGFKHPEFLMIPLGIMLLGSAVTYGTFEVDFGARFLSIPGFDISGGLVVGFGPMAEYEDGPSQAYDKEDAKFYYDMGLYASNTVFFTDFFGVRFKYVYSFLNAITTGHRFEVYTVFSI